LLAGFVPQRTLIFGFGHDEEVGGSKGAAHLAQMLSARFPALEFIWDEGSGVAVGGVNPFVKEPGMFCCCKRCKRYYI
jgi:carboxypeptidase PM20D1